MYSWQSWLKWKWVEGYIEIYQPISIKGSKVVEIWKLINWVVIKYNIRDFIRSHDHEDQDAAIDYIRRYMEWRKKYYIS